MGDWPVSLVVAGVRVPDAGELVRRHLGLSRAHEVWAAPFYDAHPSNRTNIEITDLLASAALGVRITKGTLEHFVTAKPRLDAALAQLPADLSIEQANDDVLTEVSDALTATPLEPTVSAKLLHRARPRLVPPYDRAISDWYTRGLGNRTAGQLPRLLMHIRDDLREPKNAQSMRTLQQLIAVEQDGALVPTRLRLLDIAVWMSART